ncbi:MAG: RNHCP domain-containing protein [Spirochaetales bacterium]|nr:RNHCP domain-containing protein [Spirochaetales bacterium]
MSRSNKEEINYTETFICSRCGRAAAPPNSGSMHRNHCPLCLWSLHLDIRPGDRRSGCRGEMEPIGVWTRANREWALIHRCCKCGIIKTNRIAGDDNEVALFAIAARPITEMPFPSNIVFDRLKEELST